MKKIILLVLILLLSKKTCAQVYKLSIISNGILLETVTDSLPNNSKNLYVSKADSLLIYKNNFKSSYYQSCNSCLSMSKVNLDKEEWIVELIRNRKKVIYMINNFLFKI